MEYREHGPGGWITVYAQNGVAAGNLLSITETVAFTDLGEDTAYEVRLTAINTGKDALPGSMAGGLEAEVSSLFMIPKTVENAVITGEIFNDDPLNSITVLVTLHEGSTVVAPTLKQLIPPGKSFVYTFEGIPDGRYNVVADNDEYKITESILIKDGINEKVPDIRFAPGKTQSIVTVSAGAPKVAVGGLSELFTDAVLHPQQDREFVANGGTVEIELLAEEASPADMSALDATAAAEGRQSVMYVDLSVLRKYYTGEGLYLSDKDEYLPDLGQKYLDIAVPLPANLRGRTIDAVYRLHGELPVEQLREGDALGGEYFTQDGQYVLLHVNKFSAYDFAMNERALSVSASAGGSVTGTQSGVYLTGDDVYVEAVPSAGSIFTGWTVNGVSIDSNANPASFSMPAGDVSLTANFEPSGYIITARAETPGSFMFLPGGGVKAADLKTGSPGGTISPSGAIGVENGGTRSFAINPSKGYEIFDVRVDGISVGPVTSYTFEDVKADHTIVAWFWSPRSGVDSVGAARPASRAYTITATADPNGSVSPFGIIDVQAGDSVTIAINPARGYHVADVVIDGVSIGYTPAYTFENISADHTLEAVFALNTKVPKTGDETDITLWIMLLINSVMGLLFLFFYGRNRQEAKKGRKPDA